MSLVSFQPVESWPQNKTLRRKKAPFVVGYVKLLNDLERELRYLEEKHQASNFILQVYTTRDHIRLDGWIRSDAKITAPGVILSYRTPFAPFSFPCGQFKKLWDSINGKSSFQANPWVWVVEFKLLSLERSK